MALCWQGLSWGGSPALDQNLAQSESFLLERGQQCRTGPRVQTCAMRHGPRTFRHLQNTPCENPQADTRARPGFSPLQ